jgi:hypothetical protein
MKSQWNERKFATWLYEISPEGNLRSLTALDMNKSRSEHGLMKIARLAVFKM